MNTEPDNPESGAPNAPRPMPGDTSPPLRAGQSPPSEDPPPPRGPGMRAILIAILGLALLLGMFLATPVRNAMERFRGGHSSHGRPAAWYTCGMHPNVILPRPGICPICHMDLVPLDTAKLTGKLSIDPRMVQNIGVRIAPAATGPVERTFRTVGTVEPDERQLRDVNLRAAGWIERVHAGFTGARVEAGDPLFEIYSPELYGAQQDYLLALRERGQLLEGARTRLELFGLSPEQISHLEKAGIPARTMTIFSPHSGIILERAAFEGMRVEPGMRLYRIADVSKVWVMIPVYESQLPFLHAGQAAAISLPTRPALELEGTVDYIPPYIDPQSRQLRARIELDNADGALKPGMFAVVRLQSRLRDDGILVPREAVIDSGERQVLFVSLGGGLFEPRNVRTGAETSGGMIEIIDGVEPGEQVVVSGQFLLDSESRMREAMAKMVLGIPAAQQSVIAPAAETGSLGALPQAAAAALSEMLDAYMAIAGALIHDSTRGISAAAATLGGAAAGLPQIPISQAPDFWDGQAPHLNTIRETSSRLAQPLDLSQARLELRRLSEGMRLLLRATGIPPAYPHAVHELRCPMFPKGGEFTYWLQPPKPAENPYMGQRMLDCADQRVEIPKAP